jgi:xanthine dehydrogenase YagR molybdenum-binding subunit
MKDRERPWVGRPIDRVDGRAKVTGAAVYAAEVPVAGVAHAVIVGSAVARGSIRSLDLDAARAAPGVLAVLAPGAAPELPHGNEPGTPPERILHLLQDDAIHHADQPIAVVVADTLERAQHAAGLVRAAYDTRAAILEVAAAGARAYVPRNLGPRGATDSARGDVEAGLAAAVHRIAATYTTPVEHHHPMEMHATIAVWQGDDHLTLYDATQGLFNVRRRLAKIFGLPEGNVRVIDHFVGGGFGSKGAPWSHVPLAALAAKVAGRPVKLVVTRPQMAAFVGHRPVTVQRLRLGADARGRLTAIEHQVTSETSRFDEFIEPAASQTRMLYACPNVTTSHRLVRLDIPTPTYTRAPGEASGTYALECAMDELAHAAGLDPLELRVRNHAARDEHEDRPFSSKALLECYRRGAAAFGWDRRKGAPRAMRDGGRLVGWGMATATYPARRLPCAAIARIDADGDVLVQVGTQDLGTGTYTIMSQISADELGLPLSRVRFELGDTAYPEAPLSAGSMTAASAGSAVKLACAALRRKLAGLAAADPASPLHGAAADDLDARGGELHLRRDRSRRDSYAAIVRRSGAAEVSAQHRTEPGEEREQHSMHSFGAAFADVRVDEQLGIVRVARLVGAYAAGKILNAKTARSQLVGGLVWAIGMALHEEAVRDPRTGRVVTRDLADYHVPTNADVPDIQVIFVDEIDPYVNEVGAKGIGEIGNTGAHAAIANAVFHATGRRVRDLPIRLDKVMRT